MDDLFPNYKCKHCGKGVRDRHPYYDEQCNYSPTNRHEWIWQGHANDTRWSESFVGKNWKWLVPALIILYLLYRWGII
ncbi:MAG: hypothetical protein RBT74_14870 [Tenuifilaceae bacterium]|nr:hypothetical protein [Tenuifilaceae bacterium]